jgi:hypothetical protein
MRRFILILLVALMLLPTGVQAARWACDTMMKLNYHPILWTLCMIELWHAQGEPDWPDPGWDGVT